MSFEGLGEVPDEASGLVHGFTGTPLVDEKILCGPSKEKVYRKISGNIAEITCPECLRILAGTAPRPWRVSVADQVDRLCDVVNAHSRTIKTIADRVNRLTLENERLRNRVDDLEKRTRAMAAATKPFGGLF